MVYGGGKVSEVGEVDRRSTTDRRPTTDDGDDGDDDDTISQRPLLSFKPAIVKVTPTRVSLLETNFSWKRMFDGRVEIAAQEVGAL